MICARCKEERPITHVVRSDIINDYVCEGCAAAAGGLDPLEVVPLPRALGALDLGIIRVLIAWFEFRNSHDLESLKLNCCEKTKELHDALADFEAIVTGGRHGRVNSDH